MFKILLPFFGFILASLEYILLPNSRENLHEERYLIFLFIGLFAYFAFVVVKYFNLRQKGLLNRKSWKEAVGEKAPFVFAIYIFLMIFDILTLKTGKLTYPFIPYFNDIINAVISDWRELLKSILYSMRLLFVSYAIGGILGVVTGVVAGYSRRIRYWVEPVLNILGPIPPATWIPLSMILSRTLFAGSVFIIALGVWYNVSLGTLQGVCNVRKEYIDSARILGAGELKVVFSIVIPCALPNIFNGLSSGMTSACVTLIIAEMIGVEAGLGWYIEWAKSWAMFNRMYGAIIVICILFNLVNFLLKKCKKHFLRWNV